MSNAALQVVKKGLISDMSNNIVNFSKKHSTTITTVATIVGYTGAIAMTYRNGHRIQLYLESAKEDLMEGIDKKAVYADTIKAIAPLAAPIIAFYAVGTASAIATKRFGDKKILALQAALGFANATIEEYNNFKKEAVEAVGAEAVQKIDQKMNLAKVENTEVPTDLKIKDGDSLYFDKYTSRYYSFSQDKFNLALAAINKQYDAFGRVCLNDWYDLIGLPDTTLGDQFGFISTNTLDDISIFIDNGNTGEDGGMKPCNIPRFYPEPSFIDYDY